jgi:flagellar motor switch/type III secretory pathway protein FliN
MDLTIDDIQLALSHDLLQHENMMVGARKLLASMADAQEALGRRLEELILHHMDTVEFIQSLVHFDPQSSSIVVVMGMVDSLQDIYTSLAAELYRKQSSLQTLLDVTNDDLLITGEERVTRQDQDPRALAEKCAMSWSRRSTSSCVVESSIQALLQLGDRNNKWIG